MAKIPDEGMHLLYFFVKEQLANFNCDTASMAMVPEEGN
jgi:hypothetical protein